MHDDTVRSRVNGQFALGNTAGRGNPNVKRMGELRRQFIDAVTVEEFREVRDKLVSLAKDGDLSAIKLYLDQAIGRAPLAVTLTGPDGVALGVSLEQLTLTIMTALEGAPELKVAVAAQIRPLALQSQQAPHAGDD